jgi:uncharacterized protein (TIGR03435 family)
MPEIDLRCISESVRGTARGVSPVVRVAGCLIALLTLASSGNLYAQGAPIVEEPNYTPTLKFDVAVIRPSSPGQDNVRVTVNSPPHSSHFDASNLPIKALIQVAYGFEMPVAGAPEWTETPIYSIQARADEAADARLAKLTENEVRLEKRYAIRQLLADRFGLKTHVETRESSIYNLVVAKGGVKMAASPVPPALADGQPAPPLPTADFKARGTAQGLEFVTTNAIMRAVCAVLSSQVHAPVMDKTGLTGIYNFTLQMGGDWSANNPDSWPSIFTAVQEQLGLKMEAVHESVPNLVIDHMTKPTEN